MSCPFEREVLLLHDGEIDGARRVILEAHLAVCEGCARIDETLERVAEHLRHGEAAPLGVVAATLTSLPTRSNVLVGLWRPAAVAAVLLLALAWTLGRGATPEPARPPQPPLTSSPPTEPTATRAPSPLAQVPRRHGPPLRALLADLDPQDDAQVEALARHVTREGPFASSELAALLREADPATLERALTVAERAPSPRLIPALISRLEDAAQAARAARLLGGLHACDAVAALRRALAGPAAVEAREALVQIGGRGAADALESHVRRADGHLDPALLDALTRADPARAAGLLLDARLPDGELAILLARRGRMLAGAWRAVLVGTTGPRAIAAARMLGLVRDEDSIDALVRAARHPELQTAAVEALTAIGVPSAWEQAFALVYRTGCAARFAKAPGAEAWLIDRLESGSLPERRTALTLLGGCGGADTLATLERLDVERALQADAVRTIGRVGGPRAVSLLARWEGDRGLREVWIEALGSTGDASAVRLLAQVVGDERRHPALCRALARLDDPASARMLVQLLADRRARGAAIESLMTLPSPTVVPVLLERLEQDRDPRAVRAVLARIAGRDYGAQANRWRDWWADQS